MKVECWQGDSLADELRCWVRVNSVEPCTITATTTVAYSVVLVLFIRVIIVFVDVTVNIEMILLLLIQSCLLLPLLYF